MHPARRERLKTCQCMCCLSMAFSMLVQSYLVRLAAPCCGWMLKKSELEGAFECTTVQKCHTPRAIVPVPSISY